MPIDFLTKPGDPEHVLEGAKQVAHTEAQAKFASLTTLEFAVMHRVIAGIHDPEEIHETASMTSGIFQRPFDTSQLNWKDQATPPLETTFGAGSSKGISREENHPISLLQATGYRLQALRPVPGSSVLCNFASSSLAAGANRVVSPHA